MANIKSAEKRNRQRARRRARNVAHMSKVRSTVKKLTTVAGAGDKSTPEALLAAIKIIDKAAQRGVMKRTTASRKISRLTKMVNAAQKAAKAAPAAAAAKPAKATKAKSAAKAK